MKSEELIQSERSPEMQQVVDALASNLFGRSLSNAHKKCLCVMCGKGPFVREDFEDKLSWKEYGISGMCQSCQDLFFQAGDEVLPEDWGFPGDPDLFDSFEDSP